MTKYPKLGQYMYLYSLQEKKAKLFISVSLYTVN